jgi:hypothetical protein
VGRLKGADLDKEVRMGLRWTFMPVNWSAMEPDGPVDLDREVPSAWRALDGFVIEAQKRGLNVLMQAPVVGGNAGGPPPWAGLREKGKSAPQEMDALAEFAVWILWAIADTGNACGVACAARAAHAGPRGRLGVDRERARPPAGTRIEG